VSQSSQILLNETKHGLWEREAEVEFTATPAMKSAETIAFYLHNETGELIYDELSIDFLGNLENFVSCFWNFRRFLLTNC
jgi:hypothetical protein